MAQACRWGPPSSPRRPSTCGLIETREPDLAAAARNLALLSELRRIGPSLSERDVAFVVLKGLPLMQRLHGRLDRRPLIDNDLLVRERDARTAYGCLTELGYGPLGSQSLDAQLRVSFQIALVRQLADGATVTADLHWAPFPPRLYPVPEELVWKHVQPIDLDGVAVHVPDRELTLVHLASHYAQHRFSEDRIIHDLALAWNRWHPDTDRSALREIATRSGLSHAVDYAFLVALHRGLLEADFPELGSRRALRLHRLLPGGRTRPARPGIDYAGSLLTLSLADPLRALRSVKEATFPPLVAMAAIYDGSEKPRLRLRYLSRPFRPLWRMARARHSEVGLPASWIGRRSG